MFVSDDKALKYHLDQKQEVDLEKEYGIEHLVDSLEGDFYTFDMFYQSQEHYQTMVEIFKEDLIINDHGGMGSCDCSTIEFDKGSAIAYLLDYFHIDKDNAYAFGDGYNDQAMFREVGHGIAMGNAVDVLKEKATYITDNFDQEGILKALYHEKVLMKNKINRSKSRRMTSGFIVYRILLIKLTFLFFVKQLFLQQQ